jgi:hypothetical protein
MNIFMFDGARRPPRIGSLAIMSGTLLCVTAAGPALSADYPEYDRSYRPHYEYYVPRYEGRDYDRGCYRCGCCGGQRYAPVAERPTVERFPVPFEEPRPVVDRRWVQRDYIERRYPAGSGARYSYPSRYSYSYYYPRPAGEDPYRSAPPGGEPPTRYSGEYPPAPVTYEYDAPRPRYVEPPRPYDLRPAYEYEPPLPPRNAYEYERAPRPPATVPSGYYYYVPGHAE